MHLFCASLLCLSCASLLCLSLVCAGLSKIFAFMDHAREPQLQFIRFETASGVALEISEEHLLFAHPERLPVHASSIQLGDVLWIAQSATESGTGNSRASAVAPWLSPRMWLPPAPARERHPLLAPSTVTRISKVQLQGMHAPLTEEGSIVVAASAEASATISDASAAISDASAAISDASAAISDASATNSRSGGSVTGVLASSYASIRSLRFGARVLISGHEINRLLHAPLRWACATYGDLCAPGWHSGGRHVYTGWILERFGWLQRINHTHDDLKVAPWYATLLQLGALALLSLADAIVFRASLVSFICLVVAGMGGRRFIGRKKGSMCPS